MRWTLTLGLLIVAFTAQAGDTPPAAPGAASIDANNDGVVTREEAKPYPRLAETFDTADKNKDGKLDATELEAHRAAMRVEMRAKAEARWKAADTDGDDALSLEEAKASMPGIAERFKKFDGDGDGKVSRDEMHNFRMRKKHHQGGSEQL